MNPLERIEEKLDNLVQQFHDFRVFVASNMVPRQEMDETNQRAVVARRWAIGTAVGVFCAFIPLLICLF